ncbi:MAG: P-II family nitrogen regulator [bacterium]
MAKGNIKKIVAVLRPGAFNDVKIALEKIGIRGMSVLEIKGCGLQRGKKNPGDDPTINLLDKIRIEMVVEEKLVKTIVNEIVSVARTGEVGDGKIFIEPVEDAIKIRTGKKGIEAL